MVYCVWERYVTDVRTPDNFSYGTKLTKKLLKQSLPGDGSLLAITFCIVFPRTPLAVKSVISTINAIPWLNYIMFRQCNFDRGGDSLLHAILDQCPRIEIISFRDCKLSPMPATRFFRQLRANHTLTTLEITRHLFTPPSTEIFTDAFANLKTLHLDLPEPVPSLSSTIGPILSNTCIETLRLYQGPTFLWSRFNDALFVALRHNRSVTRLFIKNGRFSSCFANLSTNKTLKKIVLHSCAFDKKTGGFFVAHWIHTLRSLRTLDLNACKLDNPDVEQLFLALRGNATLKKLKLHNNTTNRIRVPLARLIRSNRALRDLLTNHLFAHSPYASQRGDVERAMKFHPTLERFMDFESSKNHQNRIARSRTLAFMAYVKFCSKSYEAYCNTKKARYY